MADNKKCGETNPTEKAIYMKHFVGSEGLKQNETEEATNVEKKEFRLLPFTLTGVFVWLMCIALTVLLFYHHISIERNMVCAVI